MKSQKKRTMRGRARSKERVTTFSYKGKNQRKFQLFYYNNSITVEFIFLRPMVK